MVVFIREHVGDIMTLNVMMLLHRAPGGLASLSTAAGILGATVDDVRSIATRLSLAGLVRVSATQLELTASIADRLTIADLAGWCARDRNLVIDTIQFRLDAN